MCDFDFSGVRSGTSDLRPAFFLNLLAAEPRLFGGAELERVPPGADLERVPPGADLERVPPGADLEREDEPGRDECAIKLPVT